MPTRRPVLAVSQYHLNEELGKGILRLTVELDMEWIKFTERKAAGEMIIRSEYKKILYLSLLYLSPGKNSGRKRFVKLISFKNPFADYEHPKDILVKVLSKKLDFSQSLSRLEPTVLKSVKQTEEQNSN